MVASSHLPKLHWSSDLCFCNKHQAYVSTIFMRFPLILRLGCHLYLSAFDYLGHLPLQPGFVMERHWREDCSYLNIGGTWEGVNRRRKSLHMKSTFCTFKNGHLCCVYWAEAELAHTKPLLDQSPFVYQLKWVWTLSQLPILITTWCLLIFCSLLSLLSKNSDDRAQQDQVVVT